MMNNTYASALSNFGTHECSVCNALVNCRVVLGDRQNMLERRRNDCNQDSGFSHPFL